MDDLIWVNPKHNGAVGEVWHDACTEPRPGYVLYARVDVLAAAEREQGAKRKQFPFGPPCPACGWPCREEEDWISSAWVCNNTGCQYRGYSISGIEWAMAEISVFVEACPFCGGHGDQCHFTPNAAGVWWVECGECGGQGPGATSREEATLEWNHRAK